MRFSRINIKSFWPAIVWLGLSTIAFCLPGKALPDEDWFGVIQLDKWIHIGLFSVMIALWCLPFLGSRSPEHVANLLIYISVAWLGYGVVMEFVQHYFIPNRSFDIGDIAADAIGCLVGFLFVKKQQQLSYFVKKVCLYGPESTGKSSMASRMAEIYHTEFVPEVAREMVSTNDFTLDDIIRVGNAQTTRVLEKSMEANKILFCDSDLITTQIYSLHYLKEIPPVLFELEKQIRYDLYFLFDIDTPWVEDGLRDLGNRREEMFMVFRNELERRGIAYVLVKGNWNERERIVKNEIDKLLS